MEGRPSESVEETQKWQLITFCMLWGFIVLGLILLFATQRSN